MGTLLRKDVAKTKSIFYQELCEQLSALLGEETDFVANAANTVALLFH